MKWIRWTLFTLGVILVCLAYAFFGQVLKLLVLTDHHGVALLGTAIYAWLGFVPLGWACVHVADVSFPLSGYNGNDSTESGDIDGK